MEIQLDFETRELFGNYYGSLVNIFSERFSSNDF